MKQNIVLNRIVWRVVVFFCVGIILLLPMVAWGETPNANVLRVVTFESEPWVEAAEEKFIGFHAELWDAMARDAGLAYEFVLVDEWSEMLAAVESGEVDAAVQHHGMRSNREMVMDFTHPVYEDGIQVLVLEADNEFSFLSILMSLLDSGLAKILALSVLCMVAMSHIVWLVERRADPPTVRPGYMLGLWDAFTWTALNLTGLRESPPRGDLSKLVAVAWGFMSLVLVTFIAADLTAVMTVEQIEGSINGIEDIRSSTVGTWEGRNKQSIYLENNNIDMVQATQSMELIEDLKEGDVDALLFDVGNARYFAEDASYGLRLAGTPVQPGFIAYPLKQNSPYREQLNQSLLRLRENGTYAAIYERWFGEYQ